MRKQSSFVAGLLLIVCGSVSHGGLPWPNEFVEVARFKTEFAAVRELSLTSKGDVLLVQDRQGRTEAWDVATKKPLWRRETELEALQISPDGTELLGLDQQSRPVEIVRADLRTGKDRKRIPLKFDAAKLLNAKFATERLLAAQYSAEDGARLVTISVAEGEVLTNARLPLGSDGRPLEIGALGVAHDGKRFLLTLDKDLLLCDARCKVERRFSLAHTVDQIRFLRDGKKAVAVSASTGSPIYVLDLKGGAVETESRYGAAVVDVTPKGLAIVGSPGGKLFSLYLGEPHDTEHDPKFGRIAAVAIASDVQRVAAADANGALVVYDIRPLRDYR